jgi:hypothetical protein
MGNAYSYIVNSGVIVPDTADVQAEVESEYQAVFGEDLVVTPNTPQGLLIQAEVLARIAVIQNNAALANQINPNIAGGVFLDAIYALMSGQRTPSMYSFTTETLAGVPGTVVPLGIQLTSTSGFVFISTTSTTLDVNGNGTVIVQCTVPGPIAAPASTITTITVGVLGLETVTNLADATLGALTQSDISTRAERIVQLGLQGDSIASAIIAAVYAVDGVFSISFQENVAATTQTINGVSMVAHSIYVCVYAPILPSLAIATAILSKKSGGCGYNGSTVTDVTEPASGQIFPVSFDYATTIPILIKATISAGSDVSNVTQTVIDAILAYASGELDEESGFGVADNVSCFELAGAITSQAPGIFVHNLQTTLASAIDYQNTEIVIAQNEIATITANSITVILV